MTTNLLKDITYVLSYANKSCSVKDGRLYIEFWHMHFLYDRYSTHNERKSEWDIAWWTSTDHLYYDDEKTPRLLENLFEYFLYNYSMEHKYYSFRSKHSY